ncbi:glycoside hydrolase family 3 N-terminal domain-containing protein [Bowdeniella massiliensis]|uniref:glycoside hydrolase family 3 N-terminal domain-containing protein n=1 Tax=Bowdeniella massiliensis TaxID=2932264 RepID=UPI00202949F1|nr:glycoside hydrolase family 3 N-terminal domain-containing protein [Bowdeniella massiliensis]
MTNCDRDILGVLMAAVPPEPWPRWFTDALDRGLGAVCLFATNTVGGLRETERLVDHLRQRQPHIIVAIDEEGGDVTRLQAEDGSALPNACATGVAQARERGRYLGDLLAACDIDLNLAPVVDVATEAANPAVGVRSFGSDPETVTRAGAETIAGLAERGRASCLKHFPGHGDTRTDSHAATPRVLGDREAIEATHLAPFAALAGSADAIMTGHIEVPAFGEGVASLSPWAYELIRSLGFAGPILTDALDMAGAGEDPALTERGLTPIASRAYRALVAGADLLCLGAPPREHEIFTRGYEAVQAALADGAIDRAGLAQRAARIATLRRPATRARFDEAAALEFGTSCVVAHARATGDVVRTAAFDLLDVRSRPAYAAATTAPAIADFAASRDARIHLELAAVPADRDLIIITRNPATDAAERDRLDAALAERSDALVLHTGLAAAAPEARHVLAIQGVSRAHLAAADLLLRGEATCGS